MDAAGLLARRRGAPATAGSARAGWAPASSARARRALEIAGRQHGLLCIVCIHPQELAFAREHGSEALVEKLKEAGHWPRFDLDRPSVI